ELFGGYTSYFAVDERRKFDRIPRFVRRVLSLVAGELPYAARGKNYLRMASRPNALERHFEKVAFSPYFLRERILNADWRLPADAAFVRRIFDGAILDDCMDCLSRAMDSKCTVGGSGLRSPSRAPTSCRCCSSATRRWRDSSIQLLSCSELPGTDYMRGC
ncbi:MAG: hypothetical protein ABFD86_07790, partial [Bryobacteraceae bacterium]